MHRNIILLLLALLLLASDLKASENDKEIRIDPPFWWTGMKCKQLQLMVYGENIAGYEAEVEAKGIKITGYTSLSNDNYVFIDLEISAKAKAGRFELLFKSEAAKDISVEYELKARDPGSADREGFNSSDIIYLLMPDRFSNGDPANDSAVGMSEKADRDNPDGRHGGDIKGVIDHIDYFESMGYTALWLNPVQENNQPGYSYHGYAVTDHFRVDPRLGSNEDYLNLVKSCHENDIKVIMDLILNHVGDEHYFIKDLPSPDWINQHDEFTRSNFRITTVTDPHVSEYDRDKMLKGWFDNHMPDLNHGNSYLLKYLIQNTIWWIEYSGIDGIRMDTQPYPSKEAMAEWAKAVKCEYPNLSLIGEVWVYNPSVVSYYQGNANNADGYDSYLTSVTDYPLYNAIRSAFTEDEGWSTGLARLNGILATDFVYPDPYVNMIFTDNHDVGRIFSALNEDFETWKLAMAFLLTCRGTPMIFSGTEVLMTGHEHEGHGKLRKDFPGGWDGDAVDVFNKKGLSAKETEALEFIASLAEVRNASPAIQNGTFLHFIPEDGLYVYFRILNEERIMVIFNRNMEEKELDTQRFSEVIADTHWAGDMISGDKINIESKMKVKGKSFLILKLD